MCDVYFAYMHACIHTCVHAQDYDSMGCENAPHTRFEQGLSSDIDHGQEMHKKTGGQRVRGLIWTLLGVKIRRKKKRLRFGVGRGVRQASQTRSSRHANGASKGDGLDKTMRSSENARCASQHDTFILMRSALLALLNKVEERKALGEGSGGGRGEQEGGEGGRLRRITVESA